MSDFPAGLVPIGTNPGLGNDHGQALATAQRGRSLQSLSSPSQPESPFLQPPDQAIMSPPPVTTNIMSFRDSACPPHAAQGCLCAGGAEGSCDSPRVTVPRAERDLFDRREVDLQGVDAGLSIRRRGEARANYRKSRSNQAVSLRQTLVQKIAARRRRNEREA
jgi:hypothetical protein